MLADLPPLQWNVHADSPPVGSDTDDGGSSPRLAGWSGHASAPLMKQWPGATGDAVAGQFAFPDSPHHSGSACSTPSFSGGGETPRPRAAPAAVIGSDCCDSAGGDDDFAAAAAAAAATTAQAPRGWAGDGLATIEETGGKGAARCYRHCPTAPPHLHLELPHPRGCFAGGGDSPSQAAGCVVGSWGDAAAGHGPPARGFCPSAGGVHRALLRAREVRRSSSDCAPRYHAAVTAAASTALATPATAATTAVHHHHHHRYHQHAGCHTDEQPQQSPPHFPWPCGARTPLTSPKGAPCAAAADASTPRRFSISRAKAVLAECAVGVADRGAFVACEAGVLSPLLARIQNDGAPPSSPPGGGGGGSGGRADADAPWADGAPSPLARRSLDLFPPSSRCSVEAAAAAAAASAAAPSTADEAAQRRRHLVDCLDTVNYLAVDAANRTALLNMDAPKLISAKLCAAAAAALGPAAAAGAAPAQSPRAAAAAAASPAVGAASLRALSRLLRSNSSKADFLGGPGGGALLALLGGSGRRGELQEGAFAAAEALCWSSIGCGGGGGGSAPTSPSAASFLASSLYGSSGGGGSSAAGYGAGGSAPRLLEPRLIGALASGRALHPCTDPTITAAALRLLSLALRSPPQASPPPSPQAAAGAGTDPQQRAALRPWRGVAFALVPLLVDAALPQPAAARDARRPVVTAALDLAASMADTPELASALCAAGALPPTLALLSSGCCCAGAGAGGSSVSSSAGSSTVAGGGPSVAARAAAAVAAMARRGGRLVLARLREEGALAALLGAVSDRGASPAARASLLGTLGRAAGDDSDGRAARAAAVACLRARGAAAVLQSVVADAEAAGRGEVAWRAQEVLRWLDRGASPAAGGDSCDGDGVVLSPLSQP